MFRKRLWFIWGWAIGFAFAMAIGFTPQSRAADRVSKETIRSSVHGTVILFVDHLDLADLGARDLPYLYRGLHEGGLGLIHRRPPSGLFSADSLLDECYRLTVKEAQSRGLHIARIALSSPETPPALFLDGDQAPIPEEGGGSASNAGSLSTASREDRLISMARDAIRSTPIVFIDLRTERNFPSTTVEERRQLIAADRLVADLFKNSRRTWILLSSKPSNLQYRGNKTLNVMILLKEHTVPGILASDATRRKGLVSSLDLVPTIFSPLDPAHGRPHASENVIRVSPDGNNIITIRKNLEQYRNLKHLRYLTHGIEAFFLLAALFLFVIPIRKANREIQARFARWMGLTAIVFPCCLFITSYILPPGRWPPAIAVMVAATVGVAYPLAHSVKRSIDALGWMSIVTSLYLIGGQLLHSNLLLWNPLGFVDVFAGGRFYGMNNDCMGIMLGSTALALFYAGERWGRSRWTRPILAIVLFVPAILALTPAFGANVGGCVAAMATGVLAFIGSFSPRLIRKKRVAFVVVLVLLAEFLIAYMDYRFGFVRSHAGKVLGELVHPKGRGAISEIIRSKLILFGGMLLIPPWNLLFGLEISAYGIARRHLDCDRTEGASYSYLTRAFPVIFYGSLVAFLFNDTGIIAAGLMMIYLTVPLGILASDRMSLPLSTVRLWEGFIHKLGNLNRENPRRGGSL